MTFCVNFTIDRLRNELLFDNIVQLTFDRGLS